MANRDKTARLAVLSPERAELHVQAFQRTLERSFLPWDVQPHSHLTRAQARLFITDGAWDALFLDGRFADLTRSAVKVQAASMQVAGGADVVFARKGTRVAINVFGAAAVSHLERLGYSFGGARVAVCGQGPRALSLVQALAVAGASTLILVDETPRKSEEAMRLYLSRYKRLAYATMDVRPEGESHRSFQEAYEEPTYQFGSYTTSTQALRDADYLMAVGENPFFTSTGVPTDVLGNQILVYHAGVAPAESTLCAAASAAGCLVPDGRGTTAYAIAQASAVFAQLHHDYLDAQDNGVPETNEDALLPQSMDDMFLAAASTLGLTC